MLEQFPPTRLTIHDYLDTHTPEERPGKIVVHQVDTLPTTLEELRQVHAELENQGYVVPEGAKNFVDLASFSEDPDALVREMPYLERPDNGTHLIMYVLPNY